MSLRYYVHAAYRILTFVSQLEANLKNSNGIEYLYKTFKEMKFLVQN